MFSSLGRWFQIATGKSALSPGHKEQVKNILRTELESRRLDGKPVTHRRLESLMQMVGTSRRDTVKLLKEIGARPSKRMGKKFWTLKSPDPPK